MTPRRLFLAGAWAILLCGIAHLIGYVSGRNAKPENDTEKQLLELMNSYHLPGLGRTTQELMNGFSLTFSILPIALGSICLLVAGSSDVQLRRKVAIAAAIAMAAESAVSIVYWFAIPTTFLVLSAVAFAISAWGTHTDASVSGAG